MSLLGSSHPVQRASARRNEPPRVDAHPAMSFCTSKTRDSLAHESDAQRRVRAQCECGGQCSVDTTQKYGTSARDAAVDAALSCTPTRL
eukprot:6200358-Pleurochrysis_carterae.AAC.5